MASRIDPYAVLQVAPTAHDHVLKAAYRALASLYHPDRNPDPEAHRKMVELNRAWRMVSSPKKRAAYDATAAMYGSPAESIIEAPAPAHPTPTAVSAAEPSVSPAFANATGLGQPEESAGPPPRHGGYGSVLDFGRYQGWSIGQIARVDRSYLEWFKRTTVGRRYQAEIDSILEAPLDVPPPAERVSRPGGTGWFARRH